MSVKYVLDQNMYSLWGVLYNMRRAAVLETINVNFLPERAERELLVAYCVEYVLDCHNIYKR